LALRDSREFNRAVLDSVTTEIAVLDRDGVIVAVNEPWSRFARDNSQTPGKEASGTGVGTNYLEVCDADDNPASDGGRWFGGGIRAVLSGEISVFRAEYPCASPDEERWFKASVTPLRTSAGGAVVAHIDVTARKRSERIIAEHMCKLEETMHGTLEAIASMVEMRDPYTAGHERRVGVIAADIARELGWPAERCQNLQLVGLVHDIGKISIPAEILTKPGRLTPLEYMLVQNHAQQGYEILKNIPFPFPLAEIVQQHHERMDGSGYPMRLKGEEILMEARILAVADVLESMASHRPYRPAMGIEVAMAELEGDQGTRYDPAVVDACIRLIRNRAYALPS
jgi:putative nucleotidyltransferase with HDIG domain